MGETLAGRETVVISWFILKTEQPRSKGTYRKQTRQIITAANCISLDALSCCRNSLVSGQANWWSKTRRQTEQPQNDFRYVRLVTYPGLVPLRGLFDDPCREAGQTPHEFIARHAVGDWGELDEDDRQENERSLQDDCRLLSAYRLSDHTKIWIITEADCCPGLKQPPFPRF